MPINPSPSALCGDGLQHAVIMCATSNSGSSGAGTWPVDVAKATGEHMAAAGTRYIALVGFCFGGGRVVDVLASAAPEAQSLMPEISLGGLNIIAGVNIYAAVFCCLHEAKACAILLAVTIDEGAVMHPQ